MKKDGKISTRGLKDDANLERAEQCMELLIRQMKDAQGMTEQLKAERPMEWVGWMNNIRVWNGILPVVRVKEEPVIQSEKYG